MLSGCETAKLAYKVGPEIRSFDNIKEHTSIVTISFTDNRSAKPSDSDGEFIQGEGDEVEDLKQAVLSSLKKDNFKISADPFLADLALSFYIEEFTTQVTSSLLKATLEAKVRITVKANRKGHKLEKTFNTTRTQEVAIPVNNNDVTGIMNQALSAQLTNIFNDPQLLELVKKSPKETTETFVIDPAN